MKKAIIAFCFALAVSSVLIKSNDEMSKEDIFSLVLENREVLLDDMTNENYEQCKIIPGVKGVSVADSYFHDTFVDFYCGGRGLGGQTAYCGFYYIGEKDVWNTVGYFLAGDDAENSFVREGEGYIYREPNGGDNVFYIEKITDGFYYYQLEY